ncbi:MAG: DNA adenine methylase [Firmicutes bacterium]|nr:DNA adenine methylase [Bacillota bacterium]
MTCRYFIENYEYIKEAYNDLYEKRYDGGTALRYAGGKGYGCYQILEYFPKNISRVVSPFIGGGSLEVAICKELQIPVIGYDIFELLVNYWQVQIKQPQALYEKLKTFPNTKEFYAKIKDILREVFNKGGELKRGNYSDLDLAAFYYYNHNLSYGPQFLGHITNLYLDDKKYQRTIEKVKNFNVKNLQVHHSSFEKVIPAYNGDFMYLDPPYMLGGDSKMFSGIYPSSSMPIFHKGFDHERLATLLKKHKGGFILSYNDCSWIREAYKDFEIVEISWQYTMGQGETRIGRGRIKQGMNTNIKKSHELLIIGR